MKYKQFTSDEGWFTITITIPYHWERFEDEEGTYLFNDTEQWKGNFRITPIKLESEDNSRINNFASNYLAKELNKDKEYKKVRIGEYDCVYYQKNIVQDGEELIIQYWKTGKKNSIFICSFTIDKAKRLQPEILSEIKIVKQVIASIKINQT